MDHTFQTSDEQYTKLAAFAARRGQTPEAMFQAWVSMITRDTEKLAAVSGSKPTNHGRRVGDKEELYESPPTSWL